MSSAAQGPTRVRADELRTELLRMLAEATTEQIEAASISPEDSLSDDLGFGSLDAILLVLDLEERYGIEVEDDELTALDTVADLLDLVESKRSAAGTAPP